MTHPEGIDTVTFMGEEGNEKWTVPLWHFVKWHDAEVMHDALSLEHPDVMLKLTPDLPAIDGLFFATRDGQFKDVIAAFDVTEDFGDWADWENFLDDQFPERNQ